MRRISQLLFMAIAIITVFVTPILCKVNESFADNYSLSFDGGDRVVVPDSPSLNPSQITVETWVNLRRLAPIDYWDNQFLIYKGDDRMQGSYYLSQNSQDGDQFHFYLGANSIDQVIAHTPNLNLETNRWYHVARTYDGSNLKIYVDGVLQGITPANITIGNTGLLTFGYHNMTDWEYFLDGLMDEIRIWNVAKTQDEIQASMNRRLIGNEPGLVGYWRLDEEIGQVAVDSSLNVNHGQLGTTFETDTDDPTYMPFGGPFTSLVECNLVPDWPIIVQGGTLGFQGTITNNTDQSISVLFATIVTLPNGNRYPPYGYLIKPVNVSLNPYQSKSGHRSQYIPHYAPLGTYTYHGYVGNYGAGVYHECQFNFTVNSQGQGCNLCHQ